MSTEQTIAPVATARAISALFAGTAGILLFSGLTALILSKSHTSPSIGLLTYEESKLLTLFFAAFTGLCVGGMTGFYYGPFWFHRCCRGIAPAQAQALLNAYD